MINLFFTQTNKTKTKQKMMTFKQTFIISLKEFNKFNRKITNKQKT